MLNKFFGRKEAERMSKMKPDEPTKERTFSPDLDIWMSEASAAGLDGETSKVKKTFLVSDLPSVQKEAPVVAPKEIVKSPERHGLHLVKSAEASNVDTEDRNIELEGKLRKVMDNLDGLQIQVATAQAELKAILTELEIEKAKAKVRGAA